MEVKISLIIEHEDQVTTEDIVCFERKSEEFSAETMGLTLKESQLIHSELQKKLLNYGLSCPNPIKDTNIL